MDPLTVLRREHTRIVQLFVEIDSLPERAASGRKALVHQLDELVRRHIEVENALMYARLANEPEEEHSLVVRLLDELAQSDCRTPAYVARVHVLRDVLLHHIEEEEAHIFPAFAGYAQVA